MKIILPSKSVSGRVVLQSIALNKLNPASYNPRTITKEAQRGLKKSIAKFGLVEPIIWNRRTGNIVGGHQRFFQLRESGIKETDVVVVDLPIEQEKELNVTLNNKHAQGEFVKAELENLLKDIKTETDFGELNLDKLIKDIDTSFLSGNEGDGERKEKKKNEPDFDSANFNVPLTIAQHSFVFDIIKNVKKDLGIQNTAEVVVKIFEFYSNNAGGSHV